MFVKNIIEKYLKYWESVDLNTLPTTIEPKMIDDKRNKFGEAWQYWKPIYSEVSDDDISEIESKIGYDLPKSYINFLKYKHFYELQINECSFFRHPVNIWKTALLKMIFDGYPREYLIDKGIIPFANWSDWALLCFDTNSKNSNNEYSIILWDHERPDEFITTNLRANINTAESAKMVNAVELYD